MIIKNHYLHRARVTIELTSPMMIASGSTQLSQDNDLMRDENGWPLLPGTSLTGVLRSLSQRAGLAVAQRFGYADEENRLSDIIISNGLVHDSNNRVQEAQKQLSDDPILAWLASEAPVLRNGVAIDVRGVASDKGKYDRTLTPTGTRFTFEISWWAEQNHNEHWYQLLSLLSHPLCTLGGGSRNGLGQFKLVEVKECQWDLTEPTHAALFRSLPKTLAASSDALVSVDVAKLRDLAKAVLPIEHYTMRLQPENGWRVGGGDTALSDQANAADLLPYSEPVIEWQDNQASVCQHKVVMPGTSVKGAFSHRAEFHFRRLIQCWATDDLAAYRDTEIKQLFGWVTEKNAQQGHIWFSDSYVEDAIVNYRTRNKIDRLTGGTINKALFSEERVNCKCIEINMFVDTDKLTSLAAELKDKIHQAIDLTLRDLKQGRLAIGAGQNNGNGYFYEVTPE